MGDNFRLVQFTPPGSGSSIQFGMNLTSASPGLAEGLLLTVSDIEAARRQLASQGVDTSEVFHCETGTACRFPGIGVRVSGSQPERLSYSSFVSFSDPDGNGWLLQEVTTRLRGRVAGDTSYSSVRDLAQAMIRAAKAHGQHEARTGKADLNWPDWYAEYIVREQSGEDAENVPTTLSSGDDFKNGEKTACLRTARTYAILTTKSMQPRSNVKTPAQYIALLPADRAKTIATVRAHS